MRGSRIVAVAAVGLVASAGGACRSRTPSVATGPQVDATGTAAGSGAKIEVAAGPMRWQIAGFLVEADPPAGWVVDRVRAGWAAVVAFADPTGPEPGTGRGRSTIELREECHYCEAGEPASKFERATQGARSFPGARWEREHEEVAPGVWLSRVRHDGGTRIMVSHVAPGVGPFLQCTADVEPRASAQVAAIEQYCTTLSSRVEASGLPIEHAFGGRYELDGFQVVIPESVEWAFYEYHPPSLHYQREAQPIGYSAQLRFMPQPLRTGAVETDVAESADADAKRAPRIEWIQRPAEQRPGIWSYSLREHNGPVETLLIQVAAARGAEVLWCQVALRRPEDQAMAAAMQDFCADRLAAATAP